MKRLIPVIGILLAFAFLLTACGPDKTQNAVSEALGLDVSVGNVVSDYDTHSGNGDGASCIAIRFDDAAILEEIKKNAQWKSFPLDETVQALVYGVSDKTNSIGPFLNDGAGKPLVPAIQSGCYLLIDRHADQQTDILERYSFNFSLGLYDADTNTLYFCRLDT